jgi:hypothetical protein
VSKLGVFAYCAAFGFVASATIASFYQLITSERAEFISSRTGAMGVVISILLSMFGGPFIVVRKVVAGLRTKELNALPAVAGVIFASMWSVCAGIFYVSLMASS